MKKLSVSASALMIHNRPKKRPLAAKGPKVADSKRAVARKRLEALYRQGLAMNKALGVAPKYRNQRSRFETKEAVKAWNAGHKQWLAANSQVPA